MAGRATHAALALLLLLPACLKQTEQSAMDGGNDPRDVESAATAGAGTSNGSADGRRTHDGGSDKGSDPKECRGAEEIPMEKDAAWLQILRAHRRCYPEAEAVDLYKFLHQGILGPGHMIHDRESAVRHLHMEISSIRDAGPAAGARDPLFEELDPRGEVHRVHLRPFLAAGGHPDSLAEAFVRSASAFDPEAGHERFVRLWKRLLPGLAAFLQEPARLLHEQPESATESGGSSHGRAGLDALDAILAAAGYPAVRHSEAYRRAYSPAYRVALRRELIRACPDLFPDSGIPK